MIAGLTIVSRVLGFGRWLVQAWALGSSATGNAYASANTIPNVLYEVVAGGALAGAVVPLLAAPLAKRLRHEVNHIASALLTWTLLTLIPVGIALVLLARPIARLFPVSVGSDAATQVDLATTFLIVFSPQVVLYGIGVVLTGVLQAQKRFLAPVLAPIASTLVVVVSYLAFGVLAEGLQDTPERLSDASLAWLAWGTTAGVAALSLPLLIPVHRSGVRLRPRLRFPPGVAGRAGSLALAGIGSLLAQQISVLAIVWISRGYGVDGTINVFQYANAVYVLPYAVLVVPIATVFFPRIAELADTERGLVFMRTVDESTRVVLVAALMGVAAVAAVAPAVQRLFEIRDPMPGMAEGLTWMAPGLIGFSLIFHGTRVLYAAGRQRVAVVAAATGWLSLVLVAVVAVAVLRPGPGAGPQAYQRSTLIGLGIGHAVGMTIAAAVLLWGIVSLFGRQHSIRATLRTTATAAAGAVIAALLGRWAVTAILSYQVGLGGTLGAGLVGGLIGIGVTGGVALVRDRSLLHTMSSEHAAPTSND